MNQHTKVLIDADVCINLVRYKKVNALSCVMQNIAKKVYVHKYVLENELLSSDCSSAIQNLIDAKCVTIIDPEIDLDSIMLQNYQASCEKFADEMGCDLSRNSREHRGEVLSIAIAKTLGIPIFLSNERVLQNQIDECFNTGIDDIRVFRMKDIILWIKENPGCGLTRKDAKHIWIMSFSKEQMEKYKEEFDRMWPT